MLLFFILVSPLCAGTVEWNGVQIEYLDDLSLKDFTGKSLIHKEILLGTTIYGGCFSQEIPDTKVFPSTMTGVTIIEANLDNVFIPAGNIVKTAYRTPPRKFKVQTDLEDWILNDDLTPKEPIRKEEYLRLGISIDPKNLPLNSLDESIIEKKNRELKEVIIP